MHMQHSRPGGGAMPSCCRSEESANRLTDGTGVPGIDGGREVGWDSGIEGGRDGMGEKGIEGGWEGVGDMERARPASFWPLDAASQLSGDEMVGCKVAISTAAWPAEFCFDWLKAFDVTALR
jgi:hypothetical protein